MSAAVTRRRSWNPEQTRVVPTVLAVITGILFVIPAVWILSSSLRTDEETFSTLSVVNWNTLFPTHITFENYVGLFASTGFGRALVVSLVVCTLSVAFGLLMTVPAAYTLAVLPFRGRSALFAILVVGFMVPFEAIAIPLSQQFASIGLADTVVGLVLPGIGNGLAIFNMRQFFLGISPSLREAAMLDGASEPRILWSIYRPISGAALANSALLIFLAQWISYLWPLLVVTNAELRVAPIALAHTFSDHVAAYGQNFAGTVLLSIIPAVLMFILIRTLGGRSGATVEK